MAPLSALVGFLTQLCSPWLNREMQVDFNSTPIKRFTEKGIETVDGKHEDFDVVFCATGMWPVKYGSMIDTRSRPSNR